MNYNRKIASFDGTNLMLQFSMSDTDEFYEVLRQVKALMGREYLPDIRRWNVPPVQDNIDALDGMGFQFDATACHFLEEGEPEEPEWDMSVKVDETQLEKFYPFQIEGVKFLEARKGNGIIGDDMGLGKTAQALGYLKLHPEIRPTLIVCPATLKLNWRREIRLWMDRGERVDILYGMKELEGLSRNPNIMIINYDILKAWLWKLLGLKIKVIIGDECQQISNRTHRTSAFVELAEDIPHRIFLSGTPIRNKPAEFFTVLNLVNPIIFPNRWKYLHRFCDPEHDGYSWVFNGITNEKELRYKIRPLMIRREKKEVLKDLPEKVKIVIPLEPSKVEMEAYENANREFREWVKTCSKKSEKLEIKNEIEHLKQLAYLAKRNQVIQWIKDYLVTGEKLLVFAYHKKAIKDLYSQFSGCAVILTGETPLPERQRNIDSFQTDDKVRLFIGQIQAAGIGINLTAASAAAFVEFAWSPADHEQASDRLHRIGQEAETVFAYYLIANGTIENDIVDLLQRKQKVTSYVLDGKEKEFLDQSLLDSLIDGFGR